MQSIHAPPLLGFLILVAMASPIVAADDASFANSDCIGPGGIQERSVQLRPGLLP